MPVHVASKPKVRKSGGAVVRPRPSAAATAHGREARALELQRTAGNRATRRLVQRQASDDLEKKRDAVHAEYQRVTAELAKLSPDDARYEDLLRRQSELDQELMRLTELGEALPPGDVFEGLASHEGEIEALRSEIEGVEAKAEKVRWEGLVGRRLDRAYVRYVDACNEMIGDLKDAAKQDADFINILIEVFAAFAPTYVSGGLKKLIKLVPKNNSAVIRWVATVREDSVDAAVQTVTAGAKVTLLQKVDDAVRRTEAENFVKYLKDAQADVIDKLDAGLRRLDLRQLYLMYAFFDPQIASFDYYKSQIKDLVSRFRKEVEPIDPGWGYGPGGALTGRWVYWVEHKGRRRLALLRLTRGAGYEQLGLRAPQRFDFIRWISPDMEKLAITKQKSVLRSQRIYPVPASAVSSGDAAFLDWVRGR